MHVHKLLQWIGLAALGALLVSSRLLAETLHWDSGERRATVVELYTSEGCSSCPPAEAWLNGFSKEDGLWHHVIPMAFHVDYWDYIGWKDRFAQPGFSARQYRYQQQGGVRTVYTPAVLVNGQEWRGWSHQRPAVTKERVGSLSLTVADHAVTARFAPINKPAGVLRLHLAVLAFGLSSEVGAGENRGRRLPHEFVVVGLNREDSSDLHWQARLPQIKPTEASRHALVAWVSVPGGQRPLQAVGGWLPVSP